MSARRTGATAGSLAIVLLIGVYVLFVGTVRGREIDVVLTPRLHASGSWGPPSVLVSSLLHPVPVAVAVIALLWLARRSGRQGDGIRAALIVAAAAVGARVLEMLLGASDPLGGEAARMFGREYFPSGHAAVAMALCLAVLVVVREQRRPLVLAGGIWCALHGFTIFAARSHHVSDVLGGFLLGLAAASLIGLRHRSDAPTGPRIVWTAVLAILTAVIAAGLLIELARRMAASYAEPGTVLLVTGTAVSVAALLLVAGFARLLDAPARR